MAELVQTSVERGVATLTLDSPATRNALSAQLMAELVAALQAAGRDPAVRVVVLSHTGPVFCSGADLRESAAASGGVPVTALPSVLLALAECPRPVIARVGGPARAGGVGLVAACDLAVSSAEATYAFSEVRLGLVPAVISAMVLPLMPRRAAAALLLTGEVFDGLRAAELGLVTAAVPADRLDAEVARLAGLLRRGAPDALAVTKSLLRRVPLADPAEDLAGLAALSARHFAGAEGQAGMAAFRDKRDPSWMD